MSIWPPAPEWLDRWLFVCLLLNRPKHLSRIALGLLILNRKQGYCVGIASLDVVLAERLGLPVRAVATPSHLFLRYEEGVTGRKQYAGAATRYKEALRLYPRFPAALYNYGTDLLHKGHASEAVKLFSKSLRLYPADPWALNNRGLAYVGLGKDRKGQRDFEEALRIDTTLEQARRNLDALRLRNQPPRRKSIPPE